MAVIRPLSNPEDALQALKVAKDHRFIYHTSNERIVMDVVMKPMVRGIRLMKLTTDNGILISSVRMSQVYQEKAP
ncbi:MAG: hypothetical protein A2201_00025 [Alicyclobacillus sp. RIFOXYA1_FULL_53_8]|nr:MAG: hypothetical protein A2201_00025 [Alicyclobacillus sp. RIFOXYA1_FULL_53_8]